MTTATFKTLDCGLKVARVNGRNVYVRRVTGVEKLTASSWKVSNIGGHNFRVEGGKAAGGSASDWFIDLWSDERQDWSGWNECIVCTSFKDALDLIENY